MGNVRYRLFVFEFARRRGSFGEVDAVDIAVDDVNEAQDVGIGFEVRAF